MYKASELQSPEQVVREFTVLVRRIAHHLLPGLPPSIQLEDLIQAGMIGLLEAAQHYDAAKGASFATYAGIRIRGAMLDEVRKGDWVPRSVHRHARNMAETVRAMEHKTGRDVRGAEVAEALGISLREYHQWLRDSHSSRLLTLEEPGVREVTVEEMASLEVRSPFENVQQENFRHTLAQQFASLLERERLVLRLYYEEELNLRQIGQLLGVTESRVCQIHSQAVNRLQAKMQDWR